MTLLILATVLVLAVIAMMLDDARRIRRARPFTKPDTSMLTGISIVLGFVLAGMWWFYFHPITPDARLWKILFFLAAYS